MDCVSPLWVIWSQKSECWFKAKEKKYEVGPSNVQTTNPYYFLKILKRKVKNIVQDKVLRKGRNLCPNLLSGY